MRNGITRYLATLAAGAMLAFGMTACGGGGGSDGTSVTPPPTGGGGGGGTPPPTQGIDGVGIAVGPITGFGSIFVNGVEFETTNAQIRIEDRAATESELQVGQVVSLKGSFNADGTTGTASEVSFNDSLEGPVSAVDLVASTLVVLGQTVRVTGTTVFDNRFATPSLAGISVGDVVEVSGFPNATGEIVATRIEPKAAGGELELFGVVSNLDTNARRFNVTTTVVDYSNAQLDNGQPTNGGCVEVKGTNFAAGVLTATRVEVKACGATAVANDRGQIEGVITRFASTTDFSVGTIDITTNASTVYERGTASDLRLNLKIEAEGTFDAAGVLVARKIQIKPDNSARVEGTVEALDAAGSTLTMFGITIQTNLGTSFEDKSQADLRPFRFADLRVGDYLEVRGFEEATASTMTAVLLERDDLDSRREVQGNATNVAQPNLTIIGVSVVTTGSTQYRDTNDVAITAQQFFQQAPNRLVKVRGTWNGTTFTATEAELET